MPKPRLEEMFRKPWTLNGWGNPGFGGEDEGTLDVEWMRKTRLGEERRITWT
jgi:hypothetical protein